MVYSKPPFGGPEQVLKYLARYTHRVAISNHPLLRLEDDQVSFRFKNYARRSRAQTQTLSAVEFLRRFLMHVLPRGFVRIRFFGLLAQRNRRVTLEHCRRLLGAAASSADAAAEPAAAIDGSAARDESTRCPACGESQLIVVAQWPRPSISQLLRNPCLWNSS